MTPIHPDLANILHGDRIANASRARRVNETRRLRDRTAGRRSRKHDELR